MRRRTRGGSSAPPTARPCALQTVCFAPLERGERDDDDGDGHEQQLLASQRLEAVRASVVSAKRRLAKSANSGLKRNSSPLAVVPRVR